MGDILTVLFFVAVVLGIASVVSGLFVMPARRRQLLFAASGCFAFAGILGLASIGLILLVLAAACTYWAQRTPLAGSV